jgi:trans-2,3-dihydro-3-hydroxyanthranilate isomerase
MRRLRYHRVDVFADRPFAGNPLIVFPEGDGLDTATMQLIAREMNLSETVFCTKPTEPAEVQLRIFTVDRELPLAGHPVIGTHWVLAATGRYRLQDGITTVRGQLKAGVLPVEIESEGGQVRSVLMTQRQPSLAPAFAHKELLAQALGLAQGDLNDALPARVVDTGVPWLIVPVLTRKAMESLAPHPGLCKQVAGICGTDLLYAFTQETLDPGSTAHARHVWFGTVTPGEDPVTGSAAGCLASYLVYEGVLLAAPTVELWIEQGTEIGRPGRVKALVDARGTRVERVRVGGQAVLLGEGELRLLTELSA